MRRQAGRLAIAVAALAVGAGAAGCSAASPGAAYAHGAAVPPAAASSAAGTGTGSGSAAPAAAATVPPSARAKTTPGPALAVAGAPKAVKAKAGILVDATTGQVLWAKGQDAPRPIASIAKVMSALVILKAGGLNRHVTIPKAVVAYVAKNGANAAGLRPGQVFTVNQLLHAMLIESAADAAYALATVYGPGLSAFVGKMNLQAKALGLARTWFTSPDGLPYPTETSTYSTPAELIRLGELAMAYPLFRSIVGLRYYNLPKDGSHSAYSFTSSNELIGRYPGVMGIKTGFTDGAGHTLLFEAKHGTRTLIGCVLGSPPSGPAAGAQDAAKLLNWGFSLKQTS
jgi:D-alanyl-D-alanine carboxypeptidase (penicillin-binding protein 5/6)